LILIDDSVLAIGGRGDIKAGEGKLAVPELVLCFVYPGYTHFSCCHTVHPGYTHFRDTLTFHILGINWKSVGIHSPEY
jgi:hypothetical protein